MTLCTKSFSFKMDTKAEGLKRGQFRGYGAVFNNVDFGGDMIMPGCFTKSIARHKAEGTMPSMYAAHDSNIIIGEWLDMGEDEHGLWMLGQLWVDGVPDRESVKEAAQYYNQMKSKGVSGLSVGMVLTKAPEYVEIDGEDVALLREADLIETSTTPRPMNKLALTTAVKSVEGLQGNGLAVRALETHFKSKGLAANKSKDLAKSTVEMFLRDAEQLKREARALRDAKQDGGVMDALDQLTKKERISSKLDALLKL